MSNCGELSTCPHHIPGGTVWFLGEKVQAQVRVSVRVSVPALVRVSVRVSVLALVRVSVPASVQPNE